MLHTKFGGNPPAGAGEEDFFKGFYHIWVWRPSWSCHCLVPESFHTKFGSDWHSSF